MSQAETVAFTVEDAGAKKAKGKKGRNPYAALELKKKKASAMEVLVFEPDGGHPYIVEVHPKKGTFDIPGQELSFKITRGSVWSENGVPRTAVNTDNPQTINFHALTGSSVMHPTGYNSDINNNLAEQVAKIARTKPIWARGTTWGILGSAVLLGLLMFWLIKTVGGGFEEIRDAINGIKLAAESNAAPPTPAAQQQAAQAAAGHNPIAPGGV